ncbi:hypothetical protein J010_01468 [Cryptococcus neoformans]|nr:hypothetical protein J010_05244 [Cryptococcus neoformans var. grubii]OXH15873.1 hypothetical protein J010_01468 [Cryptococcus neoformans var. grubii]
MAAFAQVPITTTCQHCLLSRG